MMLSSLTITVALKKLRAKECTATDLVKSCIERIEKVDNTLNAVVHRNFDRALDEAKKIDMKGDYSAPLAGIPYLAKDVYCEKGVPTTACSNVLRDKQYCPPYDSTTTKRLREAGAISLGKSNTDEFTMGASTETSCFGPARNPWDPTRTAGGSSGGSAAGVAADECLFALGTDTGGSIRLPAGFCGCTGLRVTYGRTSRFGVMSMASSLDTIGPLTKTVEDTAHVLKVIAGKDPYDGTSGDVPVPDYAAGLKNNLKGVRIGIPDEYFIEGILPEAEEKVRDGIKVLRELGAELKQISLPHTKYALATYYVLVPCEVSSNLARYDGVRFGHTVSERDDLRNYYEAVRGTGFSPEGKRRIMVGTYALSAGYYDAYYRQAQRVRTLIIRDFDEAFREVDLVAAPISPGVAFTVGSHANDPVAMYLEDAFMDGAVMGGIPAMSVQCGFVKAPDADTRLPVGLQLMGPQWGEEAVLRAGHAYQTATKWHLEKPVL